jgi:hypothetical protein
LFYQLAVWTLVFFTRHISDVLESLLGPAVAVYCILFFALAVVFLGFLTSYDTVRFAHRIVGPLYRFRQAIEAVTDGEDVELLRLRKGDFLQEMKDDFNAMLTALEQRGAVALKASATEQNQEQTLFRLTASLSWRSEVRRYKALSFEREDGPAFSSARIGRVVGQSRESGIL